MTINTLQDFNDLLNNTITSHNKIKVNVIDLYSYAVNHAMQSGDWFLLADLFTKLLDNKICSPVHLHNVLQATNKNLTYFYTKNKIKQKENFNKEETQVIDFWSFTESQKQVQAIFTDEKLTESIKNLIKKAIKNNIEKETIKNKLSNAINTL